MSGKRFETRVFRVRADWDGGNYALFVIREKSTWENADCLGEEGWKFVCFFPGGGRGFIDELTEDLEGGERAYKHVHLAVFQRELEEGEEMWTGAKAKEMGELFD